MVFKQRLSGKEITAIGLMKSTYQLQQVFI